MKPSGWIVLAALAAAPSVSRAQTLDGHDIWLSKPTAADLPWPKPAPVGYVSYACNVAADGKLEQCALLSARPSAAEAAAAPLLPLFKLSPEAQKVFASDGTVPVTMQWGPLNTKNGPPVYFSALGPVPEPPRMPGQ